MVILEGLSGKKLKKEETDCSERRIREVTGWDYPVEERSSFVEDACQNYEVLVDEK